MKTKTNLKPLVSSLLIIKGLFHPKKAYFAHPHAKTVRTWSDFFKQKCKFPIVLCWIIC